MYNKINATERKSSKLKQQKAFVKPPDVGWGSSDGWEVVWHDWWRGLRTDEKNHQSIMSVTPGPPFSRGHTCSVVAMDTDSLTIYSWTVRVYILIEEEIELTLHIRCFLRGRRGDGGDFLDVAWSGPVTQYGLLCCLEFRGHLSPRIPQRSSRPQRSVFLF